jgi:protein-S-isoprenylcysteine O-methyltransferase Ste14
MTNINHHKTIKGTFWGAVVFYVLIAFEFAYMAGPFAVYFYSVYKPALDFFNQSPELAWLVSFFLPHAVKQTSSIFINMHDIVGAFLTILGFLGFCIGACQVYYHKLAIKGAVTGKIYKFIRHPQYASFIICSFGLLILWPRYIVLFMFITMLFIYYFLAKVEERECETKFGQSYVDYKNKTGMFLPFKITLFNKLPVFPKSNLSRFFMTFVIYFMTLVMAVSIAKGVNNIALNSLYASYNSDSANIALSKIEPGKLEEILNIALSDKEIQEKIEKLNQGSSAKFLNYILPSEWYAAEIPMNGVKYGAGHLSPSNYDQNMYKVIFTKADIRSNKDVSGIDIITNVEKREPIVEVWVNVADHKVIKILDMPEVKYQNIPVAVY